MKKKKIKIKVKRKKKQPKTLVILFLILLLFSGGLFLMSKYMKQVDAAKSDKERLNDISQLIDESNLLGTLALIKNGKIIYTEGFGYADKEKQLPNNDKTLYPIASLQKNMTAVIIAQLIREKKLTYDTTIETFYPDLEHSEEITIRDLLSHTSGYLMPEVPTDKVLMTEEEQLKNALETSEYLGNHDFAYSNGNYSLLAGIIRDIEKISYKESLENRILNPLKMNQTYLWDDIPSNKKVPQEYFYRDNTHYSEEDLIYSEELMSTLLGAGNLYATVTDLALFEMALTTDSLLSDKEYDELFYFSDESEVMMTGNISSDGVMGGFSSYFYGDLSNQTFVLFLANQSSTDYPDQLLNQVYQQLLLF